MIQSIVKKKIERDLRATFVFLLGPWITKKSLEHFGKRPIRPLELSTSSRPLIANCPHHFLSKTTKKLVKVVPECLLTFVLLQA